MKVGDYAVGRGWLRVDLGVIVELSEPARGAQQQARIARTEDEPGQWWCEEDVHTFGSAEEAKAFADEVRKLSRRAARY